MSTPEDSDQPDLDQALFRVLVEFIMWSKFLRGDLDTIDGDAALHDGYGQLQLLTQRIQANRTDDAVFTHEDRHAIIDAVARWHLFGDTREHGAKIDFSSTHAAFEHLTDQQGVPLEFAAMGMAFYAAQSVEEQIDKKTALAALQKAAEKIEAIE